MKIKLAVFDFLSEWRPPPSWIYKISNFDGQHGQDDNMHHLNNFGDLAVFSCSYKFAKF